MNTLASHIAPLRLRCADGVMYATLDRPDKRNALTDALVAHLHAACDRAAGDDAVRAFVLRGAGGTFCAGGDVSSFKTLMRTHAPAAGEPDPIARYNRQFGALLEKLAALPMPTLAVIEGAALGGGCGLAAACDHVLMAADAYCAMPEVTLGLPPAQIAPFIVARLGATRARWLMLTGTRLSAAEALHLGLADETADANALDLALQAQLSRLLAAEPAAQRATKRIVADSLQWGLSPALDAAADAFAAALRSGAAAEGLAALADKRAPAWRVAAPRPSEPS
ncbi:enoyl-CoA hydratase/isomerase family protein [Burkholderia alba]|uniref:enoyl-CoA hydratase/isomerase family protein n=1 Tax=Burkholderia alba TaxID=2683677 RepID=UPI002B05D53A|nr:enoyl-CoA hydratase/isomerase family protein [Burkholderia alba]